MGPASRHRLLAAPRTCIGLVLAALVLCVALIGPNRALCIGADGHLQLEPAGSACCESGAGGTTGDAAAQPNVAAPSDDCGPCDDVQLAQSVVARRASDVAARSEAPAPAALASALPSGAASLSVLRVARRAACDGDAPRGPPPRLRVLRC